MNAANTGAPDAGSDDVHQKIGQLTRQLHDSLNELGYADKLRGSMGELPDAQSRLSYIARLTGEAAEKVLNRVEQAKAQHDFIAAETRRVVNSLVADPVAAVAKGEVILALHLVQTADGTLELEASIAQLVDAGDLARVDTGEFPQRRRVHQG